jgi:aryl-alcohol dehydrogenase-like predicted oxidoreductase
MELVLGSQHSSGTFNGLMVLGRDTDQAIAFYRCAIAAGFRIVDTAPLYARGLAESDLGQVGWPGCIWTKIGIDIEGALAQRDYTVEALARSLRGSARRLRRTAFDMVWIHNPDVTHLRDLSFPNLNEAIDRNGVTVRSLGVSVNDIKVWRYLLDAGSLDASVSALMLEAELVEENRGMLKVSRTRFLHAIRGVLRQGRVLLNVERHDLSGMSRVISDRVALVAEVLEPDFLVCGPRTIAHLEAYRNLVGSPDQEEPLCEARREN